MDEIHRTRYLQGVGWRKDGVKSSHAVLGIFEALQTLLFRGFYGGFIISAWLLKALAFGDLTHKALAIGDLTQSLAPPPSWELGVGGLKVPPLIMAWILRACPILKLSSSPQSPFILLACKRYCYHSSDSKGFRSYVPELDKNQISVSHRATWSHSLFLPLVLFEVNLR